MKTATKRTECNTKCAHCGQGGDLREFYGEPLCLTCVEGGMTYCAVCGSFSDNYRDWLVRGFYGAIEKCPACGAYESGKTIRWSDGDIY